MKHKILLFLICLTWCAPTLYAWDDDDDDDEWCFVCWLFGSSNIGFGAVYDGSDNLLGKGLRLHHYEKFESNRRWSISAMSFQFSSNRFSLFPVGIGFMPIKKHPLELELMPAYSILNSKKYEEAKELFSLHLIASYNFVDEHEVQLGPFFTLVWLPAARRVQVELGVHIALNFWEEEE